MATPIQQSKYDRIFEMHDANGDGVIEKADFDSLADRLLDAFGRSASSKQGRELHKGYDRLWQTVARQARVSADGSIGRDEYREALEQMAQTGELFSGISRQVLTAEFDVADADGDGYLSAEEFVQLLSVFGDSRQEAQAAMRSLDQDGDGRLSRDEYCEAWRDYMVGGDAPGSALFGQS